MYDRTSQWAADQIAPGAEVYDAASEKIGTIAEYDPQAGYMLVEKGWLFRKDLYIPTDSIARVDETGVYLQFYKDDMQDDRYTNPPAIGAASGITTVDDATTAMGTTGIADRGSVATGQTDVRVPVREEELVVGKQVQEAGRVHIHKDVEEVPESVDVSLQRERVTVERVPYSGEAATDEELFQKRDIDVPLMEEQALAGKRVQGVEEVRIHKDVVVEQEEISDTVRKERVTVDGADDQTSTMTQR